MNRGLIAIYMTIALYDVSTVWIQECQIEAQQFAPVA